jgi:hypothetical protein
MCLNKIEYILRLGAVSERWNCPKRATRKIISITLPYRLFLQQIIKCCCKIMISIFEAAHAILRLYSKQLHLFNTALAPPLVLSALNFILFLIVFNQPAVILDLLEPIPRPNIPIKYTPNKLPNFRRCLHRIFRPILHNLGMEPLGIRLLKGQMPVNHRKQRHAHTPHIHIHGLVPLAQQHLGKGIAWRPAAIREL